MNLTDELERLSKLHKEGTLNDEEFALAKGQLLNQPQRSGPTDPDRSLGKAANRYVSFQIVMAVIGVILFVLFFVGVIQPRMSPSRGPTFQMESPR